MTSLIAIFSPPILKHKPFSHLLGVQGLQLLDGDAYDPSLFLRVFRRGLLAKDVLRFLLQDRQMYFVLGYTSDCVEARILEDAK